jgi:hypothetical protein
MVDLEVIQSAYYMVAATGVLVAAVFYIINLRETTKNRRITYTNTVMQQLLTEEGVRRENDCYMMQWTDFQDFKKKYDSRVNPENYSKRMSLWLQYDSIGYLYRSGLIDLDTVANVGSGLLVWDWLKFKPIIEEYRKTGDISPRGFRNFEYLAEAVMKRWENNAPGVRATMDRVTREDTFAQ